MIRLFFFIGLSVVFCSSVVFGQSQKIGIVDSDRILKHMPEYEGVEQRLALLRESWEEELERMDQEIEKLQEEFDSREVLYTDEMRDEQLARIERLRQDREQFLQEKLGPDGEYFQRQKEILEPVQRQVFNAVQQVASREGYDFVIDRAQETRFLFADPEWDVTELVLEELGLLEGASR